MGNHPQSLLLDSKKLALATVWAPSWRKSEFQPGGMGLHHPAGRSAAVDWPSGLVTRVWVDWPHRVANPCLGYLLAGWC